jgi:5-methylcytosine-specific restriction endonuclease McrA
MKVKCKECGEILNTCPARIKLGRGKFCSKECLNAFRSKNSTGENNAHWKGGLLNRICEFCGTSFSVPKSRLRYSPARFCSPVCAAAGINRYGDNNPNWKGGINPLYVAIRNSMQGKQWRQSVFIEGHFTCVKCGQIGGDLNAHHKKPFMVLLNEAKEFLPIFDLYEAAMSYSPLWEVSNGEILCTKCHNLEHRRKI